MEPIQIGMCAQSVITSHNYNAMCVCKFLNEQHAQSFVDLDGMPWVAIDALAHAPPTIKDDGTIPWSQQYFPSLVLPIEEDGTCAKITKIHDEHQKTLVNEPDQFNLCIKVNNEKYVESVAHDKMNDFIEELFLKDDGVWRFHEMLDHQGPLSKDDPHCKGSKCSALIKRET